MTLTPKDMFPAPVPLNMPKRELFTCYLWKAVQSPGMVAVERPTLLSLA